MDPGVCRSQEDMSRKPGSICPSGYLPACTLSRTQGEAPPTTTGGTKTADNAIWNMLDEGVTATGC
jgi:hypothetical protein